MRALVMLVTSVSGYWTGSELDRVGRSPRTVSCVLGVLFFVPGVWWQIILGRWRETPAGALAEPQQKSSAEEEVLEGRVG